MKKVVLFLVCVLALFTACKKDEPVSDKIEEIKFDSEMYEVLQFDTLDLRSKLQILPAIVGDTASITWKSDDEFVARVSQDGVITSYHIGTANITASAQNMTAHCTVNVVSNIDSVSFRREYYELHIGDNLYLYDELVIKYKKELDEYDRFPEMIWHIEDESVVDAEYDGLITAKSLGRTHISVRVNDQFIHFVIEVVERIVPSDEFVGIDSIVLSETEITACVGESRSLYAEIYPQNASYKRLIWESSDYSVAGVDEFGNVSFRGVGEAEIYAKHIPIISGDYYASSQGCKVIVNDCSIENE
jgi:uncharacterized protein YjdB